MNYHNKEETVMAANFPEQIECPGCHQARPVVQVPTTDGLGCVALIAKHSISSHQISTDSRQQCVVTRVCPGAGADVSAWEPVPWR